MRFLVCTTDLDPCPPTNMTSITLNDAVNFEALGINAKDVMYVFSWGFAAVFALFLVGYGVAVAYAAIRRI